jgi:4a-hydroxytetrahydrobiopterin dehydratase
MKIQDIVSEGKFRSKDIEEYKPDDEKLNDLKSKYLPDWEMLDHKNLQAKFVAKDHRHAEEFVSWINKLSEKMDHFAEVTQDVAEVTVKTTTFDVKGLTILDFQLALYVDTYAEKNDIEQVRMSGNFGMHEDFQLDEGLGDWIERKMDQLLGNASNQNYGNSPAAVDRAMDAAPENIPDDVAEKLVAEFLKKKEHEAALERAARAQGTTVEKLKPYLNYFVGNFVERWRRIPARAKREFWKDLALGVFRLLMFILQAMAKSKR